MADELPQENMQAEQDACAKVEKQRDEYLAGWQRAKADFANYKRDESERMREMTQYASEDIVRDLLTVLDHFDLAIGSLEKAGHTEKGILLIRSQLGDMLKRRGVERIPVAPGDAFDPSVHEAMLEVEGDGPPGTIAEEVEAGYRMHAKLLRPAKVKITKSHIANSE